MLGDNRVADLVPLWGLKELAHLDLGGNRAAGAAQLRGLRSPERLDLAANVLRDVSGCTSTDGEPVSGGVFAGLPDRATSLVHQQVPPTLGTRTRVPLSYSSARYTGEPRSLRCGTRRAGAPPGPSRCGGIPWFGVQGG